MTEAEAIVELKHLTNRWANDEDMYSGTMKYDVDQELINAVYKAINALEKQIAKKPIVDTKSLYFYKPIPVYRCPMCNSTLERKQEHCRCGQRISWEDSEV